MHQQRCIKTESGIQNSYLHHNNLIAVLKPSFHTMMRQAFSMNSLTVFKGNETKITS